uniref:TSA: Wollemia nobilis Ref_Wollemi_Transcript_19184_1226 transcribed RNA sequence n=1 Tax=Wollemia nobilis TaxID=56998 RepID=A0A0C9QN52_9CONI
MVIVEGKGEQELNNTGIGKAWNLCKMPFWQQGSSSQRQNQSQSSSHSQAHHFHHNHQEGTSGTDSSGINSVSAVARALLPTKRRLKLDPESKLYFPYEPGKQVSSAIKILNISRSNVAFKFQTTAPKSCFMRPPSGILMPGESLIATVFKFVEPPEQPDKQPEKKVKDKFKIVSLKVKEGVDYDIELFEEHKELVSVEQILRVVYLDPLRPTPELEKLKKQLAEAEAALEARKKPPEEPTPRVVGEGLVIDEWKERRERYLAQQQGEGADSV